MGSHRRSFFTEPNPKEYLGTCNNDNSSLEFQARCSSAGKSQFSDVVSIVNFQPVAAGQNYKAKLSDFGLAMLGPSSEESPILTAVAGTYGYAAPEYIATGQLSTEARKRIHGNCKLRKKRRLE
ncbi:hypothetical protein LWI28_014805 [Acer negundo]|uniref:Protein kinase domain-containing protein n=1 Tax=Acer negundo TaxID=4023 RepID=A0AAD5IIF5_ACENE|nr:hypothetical protein LWI28_014805 [Acer negundo]